MMAWSWAWLASSSEWGLGGEGPKVLKTEAKNSYLHVPFAVLGVAGFFNPAERWLFDVKGLGGWQPKVEHPAKRGCR